MDENENQNVITTNDLAPTEEVEFPQPPQNDDSDIQSIPSFSEILQASSKAAGVPQLENQAAGISTDITNLLGELSTEPTQRAALESEAGIAEQQKQLQEVTNQLQALEKESLAIPLQFQQQAEGRGVTRAGIQPLQASDLRKNAIKRLGLAASAQTLQGNINLAQQTVDRAIEAEFKPLELRLQYQRELYSMNRDLLDRADAKQAQLLSIGLGERERVLEDRKANKKAIYNVGLTARQYGADTQTVSDIFEAQSPEEAILMAGEFMQDPQTKLKLEQMGLDIEVAKATMNDQIANVALDTAYKRMRNRQMQNEIDIFEKYGGLTEEEYNKQRAEENADLEATEALESEITTNLTKIDAILNSPGIKVVVGPTSLSRGFGRGGVGTGFRGLVTEATGQADRVANLTAQLLNQKFIDTLINAKAQGATFGALTEGEKAALEGAATALGNASIRNDNDKITGFDMSENDFKREINIIRNSMEKVYQNSLGKRFTPEEQAYMDEAENISNSLQSAESFSPVF